MPKNSAPSWAESRSIVPAWGIKSAELRTFRLGEAMAAASDGFGQYCTFVLDLRRDPADIFRSFHRDCVQRAIKRARRSSLEIMEGKTFADMKEFYRLHTDTRKRLGVPVQPLGFFRSLWETLYPLQMVSLLLAHSQGTAVAGVVQLKFKDVVYYKFAASERAALAINPNHLIIWRMVEDALTKGCGCLDFGRTYTGDAGLMQWKARWGAVRKDLRYLDPARPDEGSAPREAARANVFLSSILKKMPSFVVRGCGALLYRYLA